MKNLILKYYSKPYQKPPEPVPEPIKVQEVIKPVENKDKYSIDYKKFENISNEEEK